MAGGGGGGGEEEGAEEEERINGLWRDNGKYLTEKLRTATNWISSLVDKSFNYFLSKHLAINLMRIRIAHRHIILIPNKEAR